MVHGIARIVEPLLRFLFPASGRHRVPAPHTVSRPQNQPTAPHPCISVLRGEDIGLVRPYLVAHERREEARRRRVRRRTLVLATCGIDIGPRWIHGVDVAA